MSDFYWSCNNTRTYIFGDGKKIFAHNGAYLSADRIKHYESIYGALKLVKYMGRTIICE